ncbi:MAG: sensor histidine kinase, partial [Christensenellales bacterium]
MAWLWITISWIITAVSICIVCLIKRNMRQAARSIREIVQTNTTQQLLLSVPQKDTEALFKEINGLISAKREGDLQHVRRENELRQEIANITHDLRTPLTSVLGYLQLMQDDKLPEQERQRYLDIVQSRARALQALITGLYDLSRLEAGGYVLQREPIQVQSLLYELAAAFYYDFQEAGIEPDLEGVLQDMPPIQADKEAVARVYTNLFQNALKHASEKLVITAYCQGTWLHTTFSNRAEMLTEEDVAHLFDRFYTADKMRTGRNTG